MIEFLPIPRCGLQTIDKVAVQCTIDTHKVAVVIPCRTHHTSIYIICVGCRCREVSRQDIDTVGRRIDCLHHGLQILSLRCRRVLVQLECRSRPLGGQVLGLYPHGIVVVGFLLIFSIGHGVGLGEQTQIDASAHRLIALRIEVQPVVFEEEFRLHGLRVERIAHGLVEVDHTVEHLRGADPLVDGRATLLVVGRVVAVTFERGDGAAEHIDALLVRLADDLLIDIDDALGGLHTVSGTAQVVHRLEQDDPFHTLLPQQVTLVAARCSGTQTSAQHAVAADAHIEHAHLTGRFVVQQTAREHIGPAVLLIGRRATAVGDGVAQNGHSTSLLGSLHLERQDVIPMVGLRRTTEVRRVARLQIRRRARARMSAHTRR